MFGLLIWELCLSWFIDFSYLVSEKVQFGTKILFVSKEVGEDKETDNLFVVIELFGSFGSGLWEEKIATRFFFLAVFGC